MAIICTRPWRFFSNALLCSWRISRQVLYKSADVAQMLIVHREEKLPGSERCHGKFQVFSVWKWWRKCGDWRLTWWSRHKEAWIFWRQSLSHVRVLVGPSPEKLQQNPMKDERVCRLFQVSMFLVVFSWASLLIFQTLAWIHIIVINKSEFAGNCYWDWKSTSCNLPWHGKTRIYQPTTFQRQWVSIFMGFSCLERTNSSQFCSKQDFFFICPHAVCFFVDQETPEWPERSERPNDQALGQENLYVEAWGGHVEVLVGPYQL